MGWHEDNRIARRVVLGLVMLLVSSACARDWDPDAAQALFAEAEVFRAAYVEEKSHEAIRAFAEAGEIWSYLGDESNAARVGERVGSTYEQLGMLRDSAAAYQEGLSRAVAVEDVLLQSTIRSGLGFVLAQLGEHAAARQQCSDALRLARQVEGVREEAKAHHCMGEAAYYDGDPEASIGSFRDLTESRKF